jgi:predicted dehydrogenase
MKKLIVFGGGRMGLSHAAMAGLLEPNLQTIIVEPTFKIRLLLKLLTGSNFRIIQQASISDISAATHAVIATPPHVHMVNYEQLCTAGFNGRLLIEKPVSANGRDLAECNEIMSGYVLRHTHFWGHLKSALKNKVVRKVRIHLETNQDFVAQSGIWRVQDNLPGLSLMTEFGSHCINLLLDLVSVNHLFVSSQQANQVVLTTCADGDYSIQLYANSKSVRKSVYTVEVETDAEKYRTDFYSFSRLSGDREIKESRSLASEGARARAYLRGAEFSKQMAVFLGNGHLDPKDIADAIATDLLLTKLEEDMRCPK